MPRTSELAKRRFNILLIKPSHYDDEGYVIQWYRSTMPSNSLACVNALACHSAERGILGPEVEIVVKSIDETNTRVKIPAIIKQFRKDDFFGFVGLVGVQSNEFPRAMDIARPLREAGVNVVIGGFHVSGCLSMLPELPADIQEAKELGITIFAGESEEHMDELVRDIASGHTCAVYDHMKDLPGIGQIAAPPFLDKELVTRAIGNVTSFDAGRGCPFQCSFCTIINVQGRKSRYRTPDSVEEIIRLNWAQGINRFFITDDNYARNKDWEPIYDRIIKLREEDGMDVRFMIQVDTLCHKIPNFIEKSKRAGVTRVFIGLENINPENLIAAKKRQNKLTEYRRMLLDWKDAGIMTFAGYILGFPADTPESIARDIEIIKEELPIDALEFFVLTPLPGSEDHKVLDAKGVDMDPDMNKYTLETVVTDHQNMTRAEWQDTYMNAWKQFYTDDHIETILRRAHASGICTGRLKGILLWFSSAVPIEGVHPLQAGMIRRKYRADRRAGMPREPWLLFHAKYAREFVVKSAALLSRWRKFSAIRNKVVREDAVQSYTDQALSPVPEDRREELQLYTQTAAAVAAVSREHRVARRTSSAGDAPPLSP